VKKPEWLFVGGLILVGAYFIFRYATQKNQFNSRELIPKNTIAVYETERPLDAWQTLVNSEQWIALSKIETLAAIDTQLNYLDSLAGGTGTLAKFLKGSPSLISMHVTSKQSVGFIFYIPVSRSGKIIAQQIVDQIIQHKNAAVSRRTYQDMVIQELRGENINLDYILHENHMVISAVGFLIEDVVRNIVNKFESNYLKAYPGMFRDPSLHTDEGNLYINGTQWMPFMRTLLAKQPADHIDLAQSMFFDISLSANDLLLSGFLYSVDEQTVIATFDGQEPVPMGVLRMIPNNTSELLHIGTSDMQKWYARWSVLFRKSIGGYANPLVKPDEIMAFTTSEIALATLESIDPAATNKLIFIKLQDQAGIRNQINHIVEGHAQAVDDSVFVEHFADRKIGVIELADFPAALLGLPFAGFSATYYMYYQDYLVLASSNAVIKEWLISMESENTWGRTVQLNQFMEENLGEANLTMVVNVNRSWNYLMHKLNAEWAAWWQANGPVIKQFGLVGMQISNLDNRYYANINLNYQPKAFQADRAKLNDEMLIQFTSRISMKPKVVKNHNTGLFEILVQDSLNYLTLINGAGDLLWTDSIDGPIVTEIFQIDYFKNGKLQYLFANRNQLYLLDRKGHAVSGFPIRLADFDIRDLYVIDYDKSKNYRFLLADHQGNIAMLNKQGKMLEGWNPRRFNSNLTRDVFHLRVRGKDRIVIPQSNGIVNILNRRGEPVKGFPVDLGFDLESTIYFRPGSTFEKSRFTLISAEGLINTFDLNGKFYSRNQLDKPTSSSHFAVVRERSGQDYIIVRHDLNRLAILDKEGVVKFEKDYLTAGQKKVQYYNFGPDKELYIVIDQSDHLLYLYDGQGNLRNYPDMKSDFPVSVVYRRSKGNCYLYFAQGYTLEIKSFPL
jgi:hypothetical protein